MKIIIAGAGFLGVSLAKEFIGAGYDLVIIEKSDELSQRLSSQLDCLVLNDEANKVDSLSRAGVGTADFFIAVTDSDEVNLIACGLAKSMRPELVTIARVRRLEYSAIENLKSPFLGGIDHVLNPYLEAAGNIIRAVEYGAAGDILSFDFSAVHIRSMQISDSSEFLGAAIMEMKDRLKLDFLVAAVLRENQYRIPRGNTIIQEGDTLYLVGAEEVLEQVYRKTGKRKAVISRIVIVGGGRVGNYLAEQLIGTSEKTGFLKTIFNKLIRKNNIDLCIIDKDLEVCKRLSLKYPKALVLNGDVSDDEIFEEENLSSYDLIITTTRDQELNILTAVYAKSLGVRRAIALVNKTSFTNIAVKLGADVAVSIKTSMINTILKILSRGRIRSIQSISEGKIEALELAVGKDSKVIGKAIKEIKLPGDWIIVSVFREGKHFVPNGDIILLAEDEVIVITDRKTAAAVENLFAGS